MAAKRQKGDLDTKCINVVRIRGPPLHPHACVNVANAGSSCLRRLA